MDPAYGDDLWAAGFSSNDDEEDEPSGRDGSISDLDLLASMVEERGAEERGRGREGGDGGRRGSMDPQEKVATTFEECLVKPDEVALMKAKMQDMERELQCLREQMASTASRKRPHPQCTTPQTTQGGTRRKAVKRAAESSPSSVVTSPIATTTNSSVMSSMATRGKGSAKSPVCDRATASELIAQRKSDKENNIMTDIFSGIRIRNPLVSSELMKKRMQGRKMIKIPSISSRVKGSDIEGDWVTMGVVVDKLPPRESVKGNKYTVWKLSDLSSQSAVVSLFLFGKAYQEHWKMVQGSVVALLNPTIMPSKETGTVDTSSKHLALSLDLSQKLMPLGTSQDFTVCRAHTKAGRKCTNFAKTSDGGYCDYHIQGAYKKMRTGRMECQGGYGPASADIRGKLFKNSKTEVFYYGGQSYTSGSRTSGGNGGAGGNLDVGGQQERRLFAPGVRANIAQVSQEIKEKKVQRAGATGCLSLPPGKKVTTSDGGDIFKQMLKTQSPGARLLNTHLDKQEAKKQAAKQLPEKSASDLLRDEQGLRSSVQGPDGKKSSFQPRLGRGLLPGSVLDLGGGCSPAVKSQSKKSAVSKLKAVAVLRRQQSENNADGILRRVEENRSDMLLQPNVPGEDMLGDEGDEQGPLSKRRKLDPAEVEMILNAKSSHAWAAQEVEWEKEEQYFTQREKKENMEQKMSSIKELHVYVSQCKQCNYIAEQASELCRKQAHPLSRHKAVKRWFECQDCRERCCTYNARFPPFTCRNCNGQAFKQTSVFRERKGPKVGAENLLLRGREEKFLS